MKAKPRSQRSSAPSPILNSVRLRNVRCFEDEKIDLGPGITVILGGNGAGKTTIVDAIASLTYGAEEGLPDFPLRRGAASGEIALFETGEAQPSAGWFQDARLQGAMSGQRVSLREDLYLLAYGRYRRSGYQGDSGGEDSANPGRDLRRLSENAATRRTTTLYRPDNTLIQDLGRYLAALHFGGRSDPRLRAIWERLELALRELGQGIEGIQVEEDGTRLETKILRGGLALDLRELSDGYQALLVVIFDLFLRYAYLFQELDDPLSGRAVVLIDEVDLHLHPRWQRLVIHQLSTLFPNTQFVLTTHSPEVVQGAIDSKARVVSLLEQDGRVRARPLGRHLMQRLEGADVGNLLLEGVLFGLQSRYSPEFSQVEQEVDDLQDRVEQGTADDEDHKRLFNCLETLQKLTAKNEEMRGEGQFLSQLADLRIALIRDLAEELDRAREQG